ncbi:hypothetical protein [Caldichromatium japonicum]|uniref:hypothetical protein n=1 Tax=Caldichromatium japonicum TaxID=2699430 RepID=UPI001B355E61|nr:hypothetical protein [Caldichromatium japonicum]
MMRTGKAAKRLGVSDKTICLPKSGEVAMTEALCFDGKILGATVSHTADRRFVAVQVEVVDAAFYRRCMKRLVLTWALRRRPGFPMASLLNLLCASSSQDSRQTPFLQG